MRKNINKIIACAFSLLIMTLSCLSGFIVSASAETEEETDFVYLGDDETMETVIKRAIDFSKEKGCGKLSLFPDSDGPYFAFIDNAEENPSYLSIFILFINAKQEDIAFATNSFSPNRYYTCSDFSFRRCKVRYYIPKDTFTLYSSEMSSSYTFGYYEDYKRAIIYDKIYDTSMIISSWEDIGFSSDIDFEVFLSPEFKLSMDRVISSTGLISTNFNCSIKNNSNYDCQYRFYIVPTASGQLSKSLLLNYGDTTLDYNVSFVYMGYEGVIARNVENSDFFNSNVMPSKVQKCTDWHMLRKKQTTSFKVNWSQCNLKKGVNYTVYVEACKCPGIAQAPCEVFVKEKSTSNEYQICVDDVQCVFSRQFSMDGSYNVVYDPNDTTWGNRPSGTSEDYKNGIYDIKAKVDDKTGMYEVYESNLYKDKNSFLYNNAKVALGSSDFETVSTQYLSFCKYLFDFFPPEFISIIIFSLAAVFAVFIYKAIRG